MVVERQTSNRKKTTDALNSTVTKTNNFGQPGEIKLYSKSGELYSTTKMSCDGFGRKTDITVPTGKVIGITKYDEFDRLVEFKRTPVNISYADFTSEQLVASMSVPSMNVTLGLSRKTSKLVNGIKTQFSYKQGQNLPSRRLNGRGQTILFEYVPELEDQTARVALFSKDVAIDSWNDSSKISETLFQYSKKSNANCQIGSIVKASTPTSHYEYEYGKLGAPKTTTQTVRSQ